jgi:hypothetical protein
MSMTRLAAAMVWATLPAPPVWAQQMPPWMQGAAAARERPVMVEPSVQRESLSDAVRRAERAGRGEILSAERIQFDGRDMHRVKVVDDQGRVRVFVQDPERRGRPGWSPPGRDGD